MTQRCARDRARHLPRRGAFQRQGHRVGGGGDDSAETRGRVADVDPPSRHVGRGRASGAASAAAGAQSSRRRRGGGAPRIPSSPKNRRE